MEAREEDSAVSEDSNELGKLTRSVLGFGINLRFRVLGGSMYPIIRNGEIIEVASAVVQEIRLGDVLLFRTNGGRMVAHRVVSAHGRKARRQFLTKGDILPRLDPPVLADQVVGRVVGIERCGRWIDPNTLIRRVQGLTISAAAVAAGRVLEAGRAAEQLARGLGLRGITWLQGARSYRRLARIFVGSSLEYRRANKHDIDRLGALQRGVARTTFGAEDGCWLKGEDAERSAIALICEFKGRIAGSVMVVTCSLERSPFPPGYGSDGWIAGLFVRRAFRRMGIGRRLVQLSEDVACDIGLSRGCLFVIAESEAELALFRDCGYEELPDSALGQKADFEARFAESGRVLMRKDRPRSSNPFG
ncbi:MAG: signal peptidase I [Terriglobia bacterium]